MTTEVEQAAAPAPAAAPVAAPAPAAPAPAPAAPAPAPKAEDTLLPEAKPEAKPEAAPVEKPPVDAEGNPQSYSYEPTGDAGLDYVLTKVGELGYSETHPAMKAAMNGDFTLIRAELATKGVSGADQLVALAESAYGRHTAKAAESAKSLQASVEAAAGGAENWKLVREWAAAEATPEEKAEVNDALRKGGVAASAMASWLTSQYAAKHTLPKGEKPVATAAAAAPAQGAEPMTAKAYAAAVAALHSKLGSRMEESAEYAALQSQRLAARRAGI